jgi:hypothetical protein
LGRAVGFVRALQDGVASGTPVQSPHKAGRARQSLFFPTASFFRNRTASLAAAASARARARAMRHIIYVF